MKVYIDTLGCAKNEYDSQMLAASLIERGCELTDVPQDADIIIVNTCGFIEAAKRESIERILELSDAAGKDENGKSSKGIKLVVCGCLAEKYHDELVKELPELIETPTYDEASALAREALASYEKGEIGEIYLAYTHFKNTVVHEPKLIKLLPVDIEDMPEQEEDNVLMNYEPNQEEALNLIIPKYVTSLLYGALVEAVASENGARMQAMDSATSNAEEMISDLSLKYNRARQGSITQELTEIIAGASAIS